MHTADGNEYGAQAVLIATGSRYRRLNVPGEQELVGSAIHFCAVCDGPFYKDKDVLVVGGGNSGFQEGLFLTRYAKNVTIVEFLPEVKASKLLQDKVAEQRRHARGHQSRHAELSGRARQAGRGRGAGPRDGRGADLASRWRLHLRRPEPQHRLSAAIEIERDRCGFVVTGTNLETTMPGVFAAGDVRAGSTKQAAAAAGEGATAALMIREYLHGQ